MTLPRDRFEVAWTAMSTWDDAPFWVDATPWLVGIGRERGRQPRDDVNRATVCVADLNNRDGRFTMQMGPAPTVNLVPEAGQTGWSGLACTVALHGGWLRATATAATVFSIVAPDVLTITPDTVYQMRAMAATVDVPRRARIIVEWRTSGGVFISQSTSPYADESASQPMALTATSPATAAKAFLYVEWEGAAVGEAHDATLAAFVAASLPLPPYWPYVDTRRPCRWQTDFDSTTYPRFEGLVEALPTVWTDFSEEEATLTASGRLSTAADVDLPGSVWEHTMKTLAPASWWRLDEPDGVEQFYDSGTQSAVAQLRSNPGGGSIDGGSATTTDGAPWIDGAARQFEASWAKATPSVIRASDSWTVGAIVKVDLTRPDLAGSTAVVHDTYPFVALDTATNSNALVVRFTNSSDLDGALQPRWASYLQVEAYDSTGALAMTGTFEMAILNFPPVADFFRTDLLRDDWVSIIVRRSGTSLTVWLNGEKVLTGTVAGAMAADTLMLLASHNFGSAPTVMDDAFAFARALTDAEILSLDAAFRAPWLGETARQRYDRFPGLTGIPASRMTTGLTGASATWPLGRSPLGGKAVTYLHRLARSVRGRMVDTLEGAIQLRTGADIDAIGDTGLQFGQGVGTFYVDDTGAFYVDDTGAFVVDEDPHLPYERVGTDPSFSRIVTAARAKSVEGSVRETVASDLVPGSTQTYVERYGRRGPTEGEIGDLLLADDADVEAFTAWLVDGGKTPTVALDPLLLHPLGDDAVTRAVLTADIDHIVTVHRAHPAQAWPVVSVCRITGINEKVRRSGRRVSWRCEWRLEPV